MFLVSPQPSVMCRLLKLALGDENAEKTGSEAAALYKQSGLSLLTESSALISDSELRVQTLQQLPVVLPPPSNTQGGGHTLDSVESPRALTHAVE